MRRLFLTMALLVLVPVGAAAQVCVGNPALAGGETSGSVGLGASFFDGGRIVAADGTFGDRAFVTGSFRYTDYENSSLSMKSLGAGVGYDVDAGEGVSVCPIVSASYGFGLELFGADLTLIQVVPRVGIGLTSPLSSNIDIAPFAQAAYVYSRSSYDGGEIADGEDSAGLLSFGAMLIFNNRLSVGPTMSVPIEDDRNGDIAFGFSLAVGVGG